MPQPDDISAPISPIATNSSFDPFRTVRSEKKREEAKTFTTAHLIASFTGRLEEVANTSQCGKVAQFIAKLIPCGASDEKKGESKDEEKDDDPPISHLFMNFRDVVGRLITDNQEEKQIKVRIIEDFIQEYIGDGIKFFTMTETLKAQAGRFRNQFVTIGTYLILATIKYHNVSCTKAKKEAEETIDTIKEMSKEFFSTLTLPDKKAVLQSHQLKINSQRISQKAAEESGSAGLMKQLLIYLFASIAVLLVIIILFTAIAWIGGGAVLACIKGLTELATACYTFSCAIGTILVGPFVYRYIQKHWLWKTDLQLACEDLVGQVPRYLTALQEAQGVHEPFEITNDIQEVVVNKLGMQPNNRSYTVEELRGRIKMKLRRRNGLSEQGTNTIRECIASKKAGSNKEDAAAFSIEEERYYEDYFEKLKFFFAEKTFNTNRLFRQENIINYLAIMGAYLIDKHMEKNSVTYKVDITPVDDLEEISRLILKIFTALSRESIESVVYDHEIDSNLNKLIELAEKESGSTELKWTLKIGILTFFATLAVTVGLFFIAAFIGCLLTPAGITGIAGFLLNCLHYAAVVHGFSYSAVCYSFPSALGLWASPRLFHKVKDWQPQTELQYAAQGLKDAVEKRITTISNTYNRWEAMARSSSQGMFSPLRQPVGRVDFEAGGHPSLTSNFRGCLRFP